MTRLRPAAALLLALAAGCAGAREAPRTHTVEIASFVYRPAELAAAPGDTVVFVNRDLVPHTATAAGWDSGEIARGASWRLVVPEGGLESYRCAYHPTMTGKLVARE